MTGHLWGSYRDHGEGPLNLDALKPRPDPLAGSDTYDVLSGMGQPRGKLVDDLRKWGSLSTGQMIPEELAPANAWGPPLTKLLNEAADRLEYLESVVGAVSRGDGDFVEIVPASARQRSEP